VRGLDQAARIVGDARRDLLAEGKPVFIITDDYEWAGELSFYMPEARSGLPDDPLVYFETTPVPINQFFFWPGYTSRKGENAIFVIELDRKKPVLMQAPASLKQQFDSVTDLGVHSVFYHGQLNWPIQLFACRGLK